jgi:NTE family protein
VAAAERALVLGGGGAAGNAWEIGVLAGLLDAGLDVTDADLIVGTSAGATAAAQISGASATDLLAAVYAAPPPPGPPPAAVAGPGERRPPVGGYLDATSRIIAAATDAADMRRRMGAAALELDEESGASWRERWRATVAARLPAPGWPEREVLITAVDAHTGDGVAFDRRSGVDNVDAVAASTSAFMAYGIGDKRYIDGGYRRNENADLAQGYACVLVL